MWTVLGTIGIAMATIVMGLLADRRWGLMVRKETLLAAGKPRPQLTGLVPGDAAANAITGSPGEIELLRRKQRCPNCRTEMKAIADQRVTYEEHELLALRFACPRCTAERSIFVNPR
jgi:hypothetical protein